MSSIFVYSNQVVSPKTFIHTNNTKWTRQVIFNILIYLYVCVCVQKKIIMNEKDGSEDMGGIGMGEKKEMM